MDKLPGSSGFAAAFTRTSHLRDDAKGAESASSQSPRAGLSDDDQAELPTTPLREREVEVSPQLLRATVRAASPEQAQMLGRKTALDRGVHSAFDVAKLLSSHSCKDPASYFIAGALSVFQEVPSVDRDRLSQQLQQILKGHEHTIKGTPAYGIVGALVHERGLDKISLKDYERICRAAARNLYHTSNEDRRAFEYNIPGENSSRPKIQECWIKYGVESLQRCWKPPLPFDPEDFLADDFMTDDPAPASSPLTGAPPAARESKSDSKGESKSSSTSAPAKFHEAQPAVESDDEQPGAAPEDEDEQPGAS